MKIIKTNCIVLKKKEMKEADLLVTLFSKEYGKIMATAYGIRKSKKRNIVSLNPLNEVEITLLQKNNFYVVKDVEILKNFKNILKSIEKLEISLYVLDSIDKIYYITDENGDFFDKLLEILSFIDILPYMKRGYKYYVVLSFLRRIMIEQGIYDIEEISLIMKKEKKENLQKYKEILKIVKNSSDILEIQEKLEDYTDFLRRMAIIFENFINRNLQVEIKIKKFIMEEFYGS
ncbi:DNA repair protein RecO [Leptotrichia trevisanii]|uniref:DNA repair protein RecO n=1 Tax=Leptotrichia trevisanii TaxID=109328 RepID=A0A510L327_9FUSO|nr:DNA repair protein RecO [Leptotrichia trevisanii]BBM45476.1 DNA repair protein RecO [Leptotrichia trevisanii]BBM52690.1 DNA repair protein RecO [Leptotrichia trevisanii]BBM57491.1 DNA repair protein RecO [Leptotrichia trevisanii]